MNPADCPVRRGQDYIVWVEFLVARVDAGLSAYDEILGQGILDGADQAVLSYEVVNLLALYVAVNLLYYDLNVLLELQLLLEHALTHHAVLELVAVP